MILFKEMHIKPILRGEKTQTRRFWKQVVNKNTGELEDRPRAKIGSVHLAKTQMLSKYYFCKIKITGIRKEKLKNITPEDALKEGGYTIQEYKQVWNRVNTKKNSWENVRNLDVWVIDFELAYSDIKPGDIVTLSKECLEYQVHGDIEFEVTSYPAWWPGNEMVAIESKSKSYTAFATEFLEKVEA